MFSDNIWKDVRGDANSDFSLGMGPMNPIVKETKRLTFHCVLIEFFY